MEDEVQAGGEVDLEPALRADGGAEAGEDPQAQAEMLELVHQRGLAHDAAHDRHVVVMVVAIVPIPVLIHRDAREETAGQRGEELAIPRDGEVHLDPAEAVDRPLVAVAVPVPVAAAVVPGDEPQFVGPAARAGARGSLLCRGPFGPYSGRSKARAV